MTDEDLNQAAPAAPRRAVAVAAGIGLALVVLFSAAAQLAETPAAAAIAPLGAMSPGKMGLLRAEQFDADFRPRGHPGKIAAAALAAAPLAAEPFFGAATEGFRVKGSSGSRHDAALLREALVRDPRNREARLLLLRHAIGGGDLREAIDQLAILRRLTPEMVEQLMVAIGTALTTPRQIDEAVGAMKPHPELYHPFMIGFNRALKPAPLATRLISDLPPEALVNPDVRGLAITEMVRVQAFAQGRQLWDARYGSKGVGRGAGGLLHSPDFADLASPPPFNWELMENETGVAERAKGQAGVDLSYYGRSPGALLRQLATLRPGAYTATVTYRNESGTPGVIALQIVCPVGMLGQAMLDGKVGAEATARIAFTVPSGDCGGQYFQLAGLSEEDRSPLDSHVTSIAVTTGSRP